MVTDLMYGQTDTQLMGLSVDQITFMNDVWECINERGVCVVVIISSLKRDTK